MPQALLPHSLYQAFVVQSQARPNQTAWIEFTPSSLGSSEELATLRVTWQEILHRIHRMANWLQAQGLVAGDRVVNLGGNSLEWVVLDLACNAIGSIHAPIDPRRGEKDIRRCVEELEPKLVIGREGLLGNSIEGCDPSPRTLDEWLQEDRREQTATILWTSGTSSSPKGVMLSNSNLLSNAMAKLDAMPQYSSDLRLNLLPFSHAYARTCELTAWILTGGVLSSVGSSKDFLEVARRVRPTLINAVPSLYQVWIEAWESQQGGRYGERNSLIDFFGGRIRQFASGGAAIQSRLRDRFRGQGLDIFQGYGLTEASPVVCSNRSQQGDKEALLEGVGVPVQGVECCVDHQGQLLVRGPGVMQGYWKNPEATAQRIQDGWLLTGDTLASMNLSEAAFHISGRIDDMQVLSNGTKFAPLPLESKVEQIAQIQKAVLIGGDRSNPLLVVQFMEGENVDSKELLRQVADVLQDEPHHLHPKEVVVSKEPWTSENGLRLWKGGINRREIERRFGAIEEK